MLLIHPIRTVIEHLSIRERITSGYVLVLGIAVTGSTAGILWGNAYQSQAMRMLHDAKEERIWLNDLQVRILNNHLAQQLSPHLDNPQHFQQESKNLIQDISAVQDSLESYHNNTKLLKQENEKTQKILEQLLLESTQTVVQFRQRAERFAAAMEDLDKMSDEAAKQQILLFAQSQEFSNLLALPDQLSSFSRHLEHQEKLAAQALQQAEDLRVQIIIISLLVSSILAMLVAFYTSRTIVRPIETVIDIAQKIDQGSSGNFQALTNDLGQMNRLGRPFNRLIHQIKLLLQQLGQKNTDLNKALLQINQQETQLVQSEKMSSLGQLVAGVAHEINNPLNFIEGNLTHVQDYTEDLIMALHSYQTHYPHPVSAVENQMHDLDIKFVQTDLTKTLASMVIGTERISEIVLSLRNFSRLDETDFRSVDLHAGLDSTLVILKHHLQNIDVVKRYGPLPSIDCYPNQLNQVFMNILANAIDALEDMDPNITRKITICTSLILQETWVKIDIEDNGPGMPKHIQSRIFEPFFTTKKVGKGTGLGMSISYKIITQIHSGKLLFTSKPGVGTKFSMQIPIHQ